MQIICLSCCQICICKDIAYRLFRPMQGIYDTLKECAAISKSAGGIGLSIHNIRAVGSYIRGTNGTSNGIVPMLRVFNDTARQELFSFTLHLHVSPMCVHEMPVMCWLLPYILWRSAGMWIRVVGSGKALLPSTLNHGMLTSLTGWS